MPETEFSPLAVYRARPTIRIDGAENERVTSLVLAMEVKEQENGLTSLEIRFSNVASDSQGGSDLAFEDESVLRLGAQIAIYAGDENEPQELFQGSITGLEGDFRAGEAPELVVLAEDALQKSRMTRRTKVYEDATLDSIARSVAASASLTPRISGLGENIGTQVQLNESDLAFLRRVLNRYDGDVQVVGNELHVSPRRDVRRGVIELELHSQLRSARVLADLAHQITAVTVTGWNPKTGQRISGRSSEADNGPGEGRLGAALLRQALSERSHQIGHLAVATDDEAGAVASAAFARRSRQLVSVSATAEGNPALRVGTHVRLTGMSARFDNEYYIVSTCHRFDLERGYETDFSAECAFLGNP